MARLLIPTDTSQATLGYLLADGSIPLTANWDVGNFDITNIDDLAINDTLDVGDQAAIGPGMSITSAQTLRIGTDTFPAGTSYRAIVTDVSPTLGSDESTIHVFESLGNIDLGGNTLTSFIGVLGGTTFSGGGTVTSAFGGSFGIVMPASSPPIMTTVTEVRAIGTTNAPAAASGTHTGVDILNIGHANFTNAYGIRIQDLTAAGTTTRPIWQEGTTGISLFDADSMFSGSIRIGSNVAPTVPLDVTGAALISSTLGVTGATTLSSTLDAESHMALGDGSALDADKTLLIDRDFSSTGTPNELLVQGVMTVTSGTASLFSARIAPGGITINSGNAHGIVASLSVEEPIIIETSGSATQSAALYIKGAATEAANNYALWVDSGDARFDGVMSIGTAIASQRVLNIVKTLSNNGSTNYGCFASVTSLFTTTTASTFGGSFNGIAHSSSTRDRTNLVGGFFLTSTAGSGTITNSIGGDFFAGVASATSTTTTVTNLIAGRFGFDVDRQVASTGIHCEIVEPAGAAVDAAGGGTLPTQYGLVIRDLTLGTSTIIPLYQQGTGGHNRLVAPTTIGADSAPTSGFDLDVQGDAIVNSRDVNRYAYSVGRR